MSANLITCNGEALAETIMDAVTARESERIRDSRKSRSEMMVDCFELRQAECDSRLALTNFFVEEYGDEQKAWEAAVAYANKLVVRGVPKEDLSIMEFADTCPIVERQWWECM